MTHSHLATRASRLVLLVALLLPTPLFAQFRLKQSTASQEVPLGYFTDSVDGDTAETGLTIANTDIKLWKEGATSVVSKNSGGAVHMSGGIYYAVLDATDTNTIGNLRIYCHPTGAGPFWIDCLVLPAAVYDAERGGASGTILYRSTVASVTSQTNLTLSSAILSDNMVGDRLIVRRASTGQTIQAVVSDTTSGEEVTFTVDGTADYTITTGDTVEIYPPSFSISKLLATSNAGSTVGTQLGRIDTTFSTAAASSGGILYSSTVASVTSQTNLTLNSALLSDNLIGCRIVIRRNSSGQVITGTVTDTTSGEEVTFAVDGTADYTIANGDTVQILPPGFSIDRLLAKTNGAATVAAQLAHLDSDVSESVSAVTISPTLVDDDDTWTFDSPLQITAAKVLAEGPSPSFLKAMDFTEPCTRHGSLASIASVTMADAEGITEPTIVSSAVSMDKKKVNIEFDTSSATIATHLVIVTVTSTDGQTFTRRARLKCE